MEIIILYFIFFIVGPVSASVLVCEAKNRNMIKGAVLTILVSIIGSMTLMFFWVGWLVPLFLWLGLKTRDKKDPARFY